ncbi:MAG: 2-phospho-L-lactate guanylyltransferase [Gammaproteobacteria bacterium]|nr:2-phospho-L-lactate guanylyltransferase [Gammaproteobacteria bacterium]
MVWALLPLKDLVKAKSRLAGILAPHERRALVQAMVEDVFAVLHGHQGLQGVLVVSDDPSAEMLAHKYSLQWVAEKQLGCRGLNGAVAAATDFLAARGAKEVLVLHGDIPLLQQQDVTALLALYEGSDVDMVIGPDLAGTGTNAMLFPVRKRPTFHYGDNSCQAHQRSGRALGHKVCLLRRIGIGLDVDTPADLLHLYEHLQAGELAPNSAALLLDAAIGARLAALQRAGLGREPEGRKHDAV